LGFWGNIKEIQKAEVRNLKIKSMVQVYKLGPFLFLPPRLKVREEYCKEFFFIIS
tara:strand:+ start:39356 stop:39520 length:165 start_codon:yes stop_codon:yes gene_type:complete